MDSRVITPLTTIFTPPPECATHILTKTPFDDVLSLEPSELFPESARSTKCYPSQYIILVGSYGWEAEVSHMFSPGACPSNYKMFSTKTTSSDPELTIAHCCPE